ncbi:hypothetical protein GCM10009824_21280 [Kocuria atrinae]|uniref:NADP-dependent oxidoreductase domain-containing protein n=1 Tax=Kocuria atrinae TaxID=592377 RepID=A0ABN2Y2Q8_9MICC
MTQLEAVLAHADDPEVGAGEIAVALSAVAGRQEARQIGMSNFGHLRARDVADAALAQSLEPLGVIQEEFSLMARAFRGSALHDVAEEFGLSLMATGALAQGFLTGKFRGVIGRVGHRQKYATGRYADPRSHMILDRVQKIAEHHGVQMAAVSLAWVASHDFVATPVASVTSPQQLHAFEEAARLKLTETELRSLTDGYGQPH